MTKSGSVTDFHFIDRFPGYDKVNNPSRRTVAELTPLAIAWRDGGMQKDIQSTAGICGVPLADGSGIAVVEGPYDSSVNKAYLVNADGSLRAKVALAASIGQAMFYDVFYVDGSLTFLAATSNRDVQIWVNERDGTVRRVSEFR
ncbi:hypothetical protein [Paraburkholderia rhizosphaerae]|uniref:Uncharacterized protein n=1 Tax=Paraburkholderia rhizosphaerae TaxID=480658 RepID=A0A4R8KNQ3_9BURK|nr:hypothetical protein [Paraburkholderia rhizosphaerae]TDY31247.1 hypothetical protein BX592_1542 [Paraburkholderia rhizosphaerae]